MIISHLSFSFLTMHLIAMKWSKQRKKKRKKLNRNFFSIQNYSLANYAHQLKMLTEYLLRSSFKFLRVSDVVQKFQVILKLKKKFVCLCYMLINSNLAVPFVRCITNDSYKTRVLCCIWSSLILQNPFKTCHTCLQVPKYLVIYFSPKI